MTKLRIGISQLFFLLCTISLYAQSNQVISGIIIDQQSKQPLPYANIQILDTFKGTTSNIEGEFEILLDSSSQSLEFSYIGFETKIVKADFFKESIFIELSPKPIAGQVITVYAYNWVERFILKAIENKKYFRKKLLYYKALAYSKTSFNSVDSNKLFAMIEALSNIYYQAPDTYKETVINLQMPPYMKNIPYQALAINQNVDINNERIKVQKFSIISPLNNTALEYYDYKLTEQFFSGTDTVVKISVIPKRSNRALVSGSLFFKKHTYQIIKADLKGNNSVHDGIADSLILFLKYRSDSVFSLPSFTKIKLQMNFMGIPYNYIQENSFIEHSINDPQNKQIINLDQLVNIEPNLNYDIGLERKKVFGIPLSKDEKEYKETVNRVFVKAPLYKHG